MKRFSPGLIAIVFIFAGCSVSHPPLTPNQTNGATYTYASTSTLGDLSQWTLSANGALTGNWLVTDASGNVTETLSITATCAAAGSGYGGQTCVVGTSSCTNGTLDCGATDAPSSGSYFFVFQIPGVAFYEYGLLGGGQNMLHVGYVLNTTCPSAGALTDYTAIQMGVAQTNLYGIYRFAPDFTSWIHGDFMMGPGTCGSGTATGACTATPAVVYNTGGGTGTGIETVASQSCTGGVSTVTLTSGLTERATQTQSGVVVLDLPSGSGGIMAFPTTSAATATSMADLNYTGIVFPDNGSPFLMAATTGAVSAGTVPITSIVTSNGHAMPTGAFFRSASNVSTLTNPAFPDFTQGPVGTYTNNPLQTTYPTASTIPGLYELDAASSPDTGRVVVGAAVIAGETMLLGTVYNWRNGADGYAGFNNVNAGSFLMFEDSNTPGTYTGSTGTTYSGLPDISSFATAPSSNFIVDATGLSEVSSNHPYQGQASGATCPPYQGAHLEFKETGSSYTVPIYAPANGIIDSVQTCFVVGANDRYQISEAIANSGSNVVLFDLTLEPKSGYNCSTNGQQGTDNGFYKQYVTVSAGQTVTAGQVIGYLLHQAGVGNSVDVHFDLQAKNANQFSCPNIFNGAIQSSFTSLFSNTNKDSCNGSTFQSLYTATPNFAFCYLPGTGENLTGLP